MRLQNAIRSIGIAESALAELLPPDDDAPLLSEEEIIELIASARLARAAVWPLMFGPLKAQLTFPQRQPAGRALAALDYAVAELGAYRRHAPEGAVSTIAGAIFVLATTAATLEIAIEPWEPTEVIELAQVGVQ